MASFVASCHNLSLNLSVVAYKVTNFYNGSADGAVFWASPSLNIKWP
ncbi:MAG: dTDP-4-keto-6-deoxy-D-glucose epimerase, partial [Symploca sp. SIO3E6]|nr:dTDP-4-keto-6-deoxy-D-glucose epimerase [Caldora sp. SIO3E6]